MGARDIQETVECANLKAGDAVGVPKQNWYVAIVNNNSEKVYAEKLQKLGYESYLPTQREERHWSNGKINTIDKVILPSVVFVRVTESERLKSVVKLPYIKKFMVDISRVKDQFGKHPIAIIPNNQVEQLRLMLEHAESPVTIESIPFHLGDKIRIINGKLQGLEGNVIHCSKGASFIVIRLECLGCAKMKLMFNQVEMNRIR